VHKTDLQVLANQLNALAEVFEKKPVSPKGLEVWFDTLRDFPTERVISVLIGWAKTHTKYPSPAEVWKVVNEISIDLREEKVKQERAQIEREYQHMGATPQGNAIIKKMYEILAKPKRTPRQHWEWVMRNPKAPHIATECAKEALKRWQVVEREPGCDDEIQEARQVSA
jgi:hypothetical protein